MKIVYKRPGTSIPQYFAIKCCNFHYWDTARFCGSCGKSFDINLIKKREALNMIYDKYQFSPHVDQLVESSVSKTE